MSYFQVTAQFSDPNQGKLVMKCRTQSLAYLEVRSIRHRFAALKAIWVDYPTGEREVFAPTAGGVEHLLVIPAEAMKGER